MTNEPQVWHYGLMAERWSEYITDTPELPFFEKQIGLYGEPVLDLACGAGRLLIPLLRAGIDIDGCDISGDMIKHCQKKAGHEGFNPNLFEEPMHSFKLPRKYRTIYICGSFGLAGSREKDLQTLQRCHEHLEVGGALLFNIQAEYSFSESWNLWLKENRQQLPAEWPEEGSRRVGPDGSQNIAYFRDIDIDPLQQSYIKQVRLEKWISGKQVASEEYTLRGNMYFKNEVAMMLEIAGFRETTVLGDYTDEIAAADNQELIFRALK